MNKSLNVVLVAVAVPIGVLVWWLLVTQPTRSSFVDWSDAPLLPPALQDELRELRTSGPAEYQIEYRSRQRRVVIYVPCEADAVRDWMQPSRSLVFEHTPSVDSLPRQFPMEGRDAEFVRASDNIMTTSMHGARLIANLSTNEIEISY